MQFRCVRCVDVLRSRVWIADVKGTVAPHCVHHDGKFACDGDAGFRVTLGLRELQPPCLDHVAALEPGEHRRRSLVERAAHVGIARLADATVDIDRGARLPSLRRQPEVGRDIARTTEALRVVDRAAEAERGDGTNTGDCHKPPT